MYPTTPPSTGRTTSSSNASPTESEQQVLMKIWGIKAVFTDMDGTFWNSTVIDGDETPNEVQENLECVAELNYAGVEVIPASGRGRASTLNEAQSRGIPAECFPRNRGPGVFVDGAYVFADDSETPLYVERFPSCALSPIWEVVKHHEGYLHWWCLDEIVGMAGRNCFDQKHFKEQRMPHRCVPKQGIDVDIANENCVALWIVCNHLEDCMKLRHAVEPVAKEFQLRMMYYSMSGWIVLMSNKANKYVGLRRIMAARGWTPEEVLVIGDGINDTEMLEGMPHSVAMLDGVASAKCVAKMITSKSCADAGWADCMRTVILQAKENKTTPN